MSFGHATGILESTDYDEGPSVFHVEDIEIPVSHPAGKIMIRVYTPAGPGPFPVHLNFHGGTYITCTF
jgi:acetyl esterase/lipase